METPRLFQYAVLWHPTAKQREDDGEQSKILEGINAVLAASEQAATLAAARSIPGKYSEELDQIEVVIRPF